MAELQEPLYLENGSAHTAQGMRLAHESLVATEGIVGASDLAVSEKSGTADMSVDVAAGAAFVAGDEQSHQGTYHVYNDAVVNLSIAAADATNPRKDLVVAKVQDSQYSGATDSWSLAVVTGTAAASPSEPSAPDNSIVLALVDVAAGASSIVDANITDRRTQAALTDTLIAASFETAGISLSSAQPVNRITQTPVEFDTVDFEDGVTTDVVTDHDLTIVTPGLYLLTYFGYWADDDINRRLAWITKNGSRILGEDKPAQSTSDTTVSSIVPLVANDTIGALVRHESTTNPLDLTYAELRVVRLRATP